MVAFWISQGLQRQEENILRFRHYKEKGTIIQNSNAKSIFFLGGGGGGGAPHIISNSLLPVLFMLIFKIIVPDLGLLQDTFDSLDQLGQEICPLSIIKEGPSHAS